MNTENPDKNEITAPNYIRANFDPSDRLAVLVRNRRRGDTLQRISTAVRIAAPQFQDWLRYKNERDGSDIYLGMNPLKPEAHTRTKDDIQAIKHLYIDLDHDGSQIPRGHPAVGSCADPKLRPEHVARQISGDMEGRGSHSRASRSIPARLGAGIRWRSRCNRFDKSAPSSGFREQKVRGGLSGNSPSPRRPHLSRTRFQTSHRSSGLWPRKMESVS